MNTGTALEKLKAILIGLVISMAILGLGYASYATAGWWDGKTQTRITQVNRTDVALKPTQTPEKFRRNATLWIGHLNNGAKLARSGIKRNDEDMLDVQKRLKEAEKLIGELRVIVKKLRKIKHDKLHAHKKPVRSRCGPQCRKRKHMRKVKRQKKASLRTRYNFNGSKT